ncbi:MAG TPA: EamA family transporter [Acidimicrobiales bacterium]|nr:EamA family transporter [Acidimicrobiales bacterium]
MTRRGWVLFISLGVIWGLPYMLIKIAVREVNPDLLVFFRTAGGALLLGPFAVAKGQLKGLLKLWLPLLVYTAAEIAVPWVLLFNAEKRLPSSLTGLLIAAVPLVGALLALTTGSDTLDRRRLLGLMVGFGGVAALVGFAVGGSDVWAAVSLIGVVVGYALGPWILARYLAEAPPMGVVTGSLILAALVYAPLAAFHLPRHALSASVLESVIGLTVICTVIAFLVFFALIAEVGPMRATVITYVNPAVAVVLGVAFLGESFGVATGVGFVLILGGCFLATQRARSQDAVSLDTAAELPAVAEP